MTSRVGETEALRKHLVVNIRRIMIVMTRLAELLVAQKLDGGKSPAPCFEFYPPTPPAQPGQQAPPASPPLSPEDLFTRLQAEIAEAAKLGDEAVQKALEEITKSIDDCKPTL